MSHLTVIVITLISTITVDKQRYFIFQVTGFTFIACFLSTLRISQSNSLENFHDVKPSYQRIQKLCNTLC